MGWNNVSQGRAHAGQQFWRQQSFGAHGTYSDVWAGYLGRDPGLRRVVMVIELVLGGGQRWYLCSEPTTLIRSFGEKGNQRTVGFVGQLIEEPEITSEYSIGEGTASQRSISINVAVPGFSPWKVIRTQQRILAGFGQVSLIAPGIGWEDRFVLMTGDMVGGVTFGNADETVSIKLQDPTLTVDLGVTEYVADTERLPNLPDDYVGFRYPLAINSPRTVSCLRTDGTSTPDFLICVGHEYDVTEAFVDGVEYAQASLVYPWSVVYLNDARGVPYTAIRFSAGSGAWEDTTSVHCTLQPRAGRRSSKDVIETIRELITDWSLLGPNTISHEAFSRALGRIRTLSAPGVFINGSNDNNATRALEYIEGTICAEMPMISMAWQPGGYGPVVTDRKSEPVAKWVVGQGPLLDRASAWTESDKAGVLNWLTLRYNYNAADDSFDGVEVRNPNNNTLCQISEEQSGPLDDGVRESVIILTSALATWVIDWLVEHFAMPFYEATYNADPEVILKYRLGDNIDLVESEIDGCTFDSPVRATITSISYRRGGCTVKLALWVLYTQFGGGVSSGEGVPIVVEEEQQV